MARHRATRRCSTISSGRRCTGTTPASCSGCRDAGGVQKNFAASLDQIAERDAAGKPIEIWFQDEARIGQKNKITRRWAQRGTRPSAPHDQRTRSAYIFGAICPAQGIAAGLVLPRCNTAAMALHLAEISRTVTPGAHAVLLLDQAGWHLSAKLDVPNNITLMPLPPKSPELNPVENIWQFIRDNWLSNRVFRSYDDIVDHCCFAWNRRPPTPIQVRFTKTGPVLSARTASAMISISGAVIASKIAAITKSMTRLI